VSAEFAIVKAAWQMRESGQRLEHGHDPRVTEAERGGPLSPLNQPIGESRDSLGKLSGR
jgi:hypothetical protein